jgi:predicted DNA-binding antitoxin AbrB/MazE fold protein
MTTVVEAVYEHGVLRLKEPLPLSEGTVVQVTVTTRDQTSNQQTPAEILSAIAALAEPGAEELTSRDHDAILYGEQGAR